MSIKTFIRSNVVKGRKEEAPRVLYLLFCMYTHTDIENCNRHHAGVYNNRNGNFSEIISSLFLWFFIASDRLLDNDTQKEDTDGQFADKKNVSSTRQTTIRSSPASSAL